MKGTLEFNVLSLNLEASRTHISIKLFCEVPQINVRIYAKQNKWRGTHSLRIGLRLRSREVEMSLITWYQGALHKTIFKHTLRHKTILTTRRYR